MGTLRNNRVVIASLFLPSTIAFDSDVQTPDEHLKATDILHTALSKSINAGEIKTGGANPSQAAFLKPAHQRHLSYSGPPKSIVDDLKDKASSVLKLFVIIASLNCAYCDYSL